MSTENVKAEIIQVTPELAEKWLGKNLHNRNLRNTQVQAIARDMRADNFVFTADTIKFSEDGSLHDGQHRLAAVVVSGQTVPMLVVHGLKPEAQSFMDMGAPRRASDQLQLRGQKNAHHVAATVRKAVLWDKGIRAFKSEKVTNAEIYDYIDQNPGIIWSCDLSMWGRRHVPVPSSLIGVLHWVCTRIDGEAANDFFDRQLIRGERLFSGDPVMALRRRLALQTLSTGSIREVDATGYILSAWNHWRAGNVIGSLPAPKSTGWTANNIPDPR